MKFTFKKGFTLIELLVVISIIGVLSSIVLSSVSNIRKRAEDTRFASSLRSFQAAMELYYLDNGEYPRRSGSNDVFYNFFALPELEAQLAPYTQSEFFLTDLPEGYSFSVFVSGGTISFCPAAQGGSGQSYAYVYNVSPSLGEGSPYFQSEVDFTPLGFDFSRSTHCVTSL